MTTTRQTAGWKRTTAVAGTTALLAVVVAASVAAHRMQTGGPMTEQNKAIALRWSEELWSKGDLAVADEIVAADYVRHDPAIRFRRRARKT
jgi:hypothetical protein